MFVKNLEILAKSFKYNNIHITIVKPLMYIDYIHNLQDHAT